MSATPVVSVIIPTHNCLSWLPRAIESVGNRQDVEIVVFDDGSTDGTDAWLTEQAGADGRIIAMRGQGVGPSKARNMAIASARAPLLAFLDADDCWHPNKLATQLALHAAAPEVGFSFTDYRHVTETGDDRGACFANWRDFGRRVRSFDRPFALGADAMAVLFAETLVGTSTVMARTDLVRELGGFSEDLPASEDWDLWLRLARHAPVMCIPDILADDMTHRMGSASRKMRARALAMRMIGARHGDAVRRISRRAMRHFTARLREADAEIARKTGDVWTELGYRIAAIGLAPSNRTTREFLGVARRAFTPRRLGRMSGLPGTAELSH